MPEAAVDHPKLVKTLTIIDSNTVAPGDPPPVAGDIPALFVAGGPPINKDSIRERLLSTLYSKETIADIKLDETRQEPLRLRGWVNIGLLAGVVACVAFVDPHRPLPGTSFTPFPFMRELLMLGLVALSLWRTPSGIRKLAGRTIWAWARLADSSRAPPSTTIRGTQVYVR